MSRELLLTSSRRVEVVDLPEISGTIHVRSLSAKEAAGLYEKIAQTKDASELAALQVAAFASDADGNAMFSDEDARQVIERQSFVVVNRIVRAGAKLNAFSDEAVEAAAGN